MRAWSEWRVGDFIASEADLGPFLLAAYGRRRRFCWEVALGSRHGRLVAHGEATSLHAARAAAEAAALAQLATAPPGAARGLPPVPQTWH